MGQNLPPSVIECSNVVLPCSVSENDIQGSGEAFGKVLKANSSIKELKLINCRLNSTDGEALASGLAVNTSLTEVNLRRNQFGEKEWCTIFDKLRSNPQNKITKWELTNESINPTIVKSLSAYVAVSTSLTSLE